MPTVPTPPPALQNKLRGASLALGRALVPVRLRGIARLFRVLSPWVLGRGVQLVDTVAGFRIAVDPTDYAGAMMVYGRYSPELLTVLRAMVRPGDRVLDIGAQLGYITAHLARLVGPAGRVHSVEPDPNALARLRAAVSANALEQVRVLPFAAGATPGEIEFFVSPVLGWSTAVDGTHLTGLSKIRVECKPIDHLAAEGAVEGPISLAKIDVEGFECSVLDGMRELITRDKPALVMEVNPRMLEAAGFSARDLLDRIIRHEYKVYQVERPSRGFSNDRVLLRPIDAKARLEFCDVLCIPPGRAIPAGLPVL